jgi:hypothetical protein
MSDTTTLTRHLCEGDESNAHVVKGWPYGRVKRCYKRFWIERHKNGTVRMVMQTSFPWLPDDISPEYGDCRWNKPKLGVYQSFIILYTDTEDGTTHHTCLGKTPWAEHIQKFLDKWGSMLTDDEVRAVSNSSPY